MADVMFDGTVVVELTLNKFQLWGVEPTPEAIAEEVTGLIKDNFDGIQEVKLVSSNIHDIVIQEEEGLEEVEVEDEEKGDEK